MFTELNATNPLESTNPKKENNLIQDTLKVKNLAYKTKVGLK